MGAELGTPLLVDEREARRLLGGLCAKTMFKPRRAGEPLGSRVMYDVADLRAFLERQKEAVTMSNKWPRVTTENSCPKCGKSDGCLVATGGTAGHCVRAGVMWRDGTGSSSHGGAAGAGGQP